MKDLSIDIETYSSNDIKSMGLYKYTEAEDFTILLFAYSVDFNDVEIVDLEQGESLPDEIVEAVADDQVVKHAYNAAFEYNALKAAGYNVGMREAWHCTMLHAMYLGYPSGLAATGEALGLPADKKKGSIGKALIRYFSVPCSPTKANGGRTRNLPKHDPEKWALFKDYCKQDVVAESTIYQYLAQFPVPDREQELWALQDEMNARGVMVDFDLVDGALEIDKALTEEQTKRAKDISGLQNPNSTTQLLAYLQSKGVEVDNLRKASVSDLLAKKDLPRDVEELLKLRQELSKTSVKKYVAMENCAGDDHRMRGLLQFYGANRTGRWAGRLVQVQNLPRNYLKTLEEARLLVKDGDKDSIAMIYGNATDTLSQLIRTAFIPEDGKKFVVSDYSAIEARVLAWLAGETWVNEVFATHGKIYEATASQMFGVPVEKIKKGNPEYSLRQKGKVATLALGYQGGVGALKAMGADKMGLDDEELDEIVVKWRNANPRIVAFWYGIQDAAIRAIENGGTEPYRDLTLRYEAEGIYGTNYLTIELPSGRKLFYPRPSIEENRFGRPSMRFMGISAAKKFEKESTYGGKLTENVTQAIARDCLALTLLRLRKKLGDRARVVMHIHDEVVIESEPDITLEEVNAVLAEPIDWAPGLILKGAGFESQFYKKD